ncbi:phosphoribosyltransferase [Aeromonas hydrophila]|uniref:phosphoribosyltransferase n=1 Tax=Aeromonas hydrophila TaxID=644 RepID=UPI00398A3708
MNPNNIWGDISFNDIILWLLSLSTLIFILDSLGLLPRFIARYLAKNRMDSTLKALDEIGAHISWYKEKTPFKNFQIRVCECLNGKPEYVVRLQGLLEEHTISSGVNIGETRSFSTNAFYDVIGSTTCPDVAIEYAKILNTFMSEYEINRFDIIATPKDGAPLLGYELAKMRKTPFVLGVCKKGMVVNNDYKSHFELDYPLTLNLKDKRILLVDDSTTGGRKMLSLAERLRQEGAIIENAIILFEPQGKGAREALKKLKIELHAIVKGPKGKI